MLTTDPKLLELIDKAKAAYEAMNPDEKAEHDHEQRRSFVRGMCPGDKNYADWCRAVDKVIPPLRRR